MKKAVFLFNKTMVAPQPWLDAGYECWIFDSQHAPGVVREGNLVTVGMKVEVYKLEGQIEAIAALVGDGVEFVCSFAPCTFLTVSGARWLYHPDDKLLPIEERRPHPAYPTRREDQADAVEMARMVERLALALNTDCWMLENPAVSFLNKRWRKPDYRFDPCDFGGYLPEDDVNPYYPRNYPPRDAYFKASGLWTGAGFIFPEKKPVTAVQGGFHEVTKGGGGSLANKNMRSATPRGLALAVFAANGVKNVSES